jgi:hypothetical protein
VQIHRDSSNREPRDGHIPVIVRLPVSAINTSLSQIFSLMDRRPDPVPEDTALYFNIFRFWHIDIELADVVYSLKCECGARGGRFGMFWTLGKGVA